jgi:hypothetical protein
MIHQCDNIDSLNTSLGKFNRCSQLMDIADLYPYAAGKKSEEDLKNHKGIICWVYVRDCKSDLNVKLIEVAKAHVKALLVPEAGGERFTTSAGPFAAQDWCDVSPSASLLLFPTPSLLGGQMRWTLILGPP